MNGPVWVPCITDWVATKPPPVSPLLITSNRKSGKAVNTDLRKSASAFPFRGWSKPRGRGFLHLTWIAASISCPAVAIVGWPEMKDVSSAWAGIILGNLVGGNIWIWQFADVV
jgi:hypothetical protein